MEAAQEDSVKIFAGVSFILLGFDSISHQMVRSKIVDSGGLEIGCYGADCTHVIVDKVVYDDPVCVAARRDGKALVTSLWVEHSFDAGMAVDPSSIMYRPLRDLDGIPGAESLVICLTGYLRLDREDIMTMVDLMGANFSKPLIANKVTHLICYKFEGEKYELAKKMMTIKLVNHLWLEDCLKNWKIMPEADYEKSGYELEMMEAEAKDSEDEAPITATKQQLKREIASISNPLLTKEKDAKPSGVKSEKGTPSGNEISASETGNAEKSCSGLQLHPMDKTPSPATIRNDSSSVSNGDKKSPQFRASNHVALSYSRKTPMKATLPLEPVGSPIVNACFPFSSSRTEEKETLSTGPKSKLGENLSHPKDVGSLPGKRKAAISSGSSKSKRTDHSLNIISEGCGSDMDRSEQFAPEPLTNQLQRLTGHSPVNNSHNADTDGHLSPQKDSPIQRVRPEINCGGKTVLLSSERRKTTNLDHKAEVADIIVNRPEILLNDSTKPQNGEVSPPGTNVSGVAKSNTVDSLDYPEGETGSRSKPLRKKQPAKRTSGKKQLAKKSLGSRPSFDRKKAGYQKISYNINEEVSVKNSLTASNEGKESEELERNFGSGKIRVVSPSSDADIDKDIKMGSVLEFSSGDMDKVGILDEETEAPKNQKDNESGAIFDKGESGDVDVLNSVDTRTGAEVGGVEKEQTDDKVPVKERDVFNFCEENSITEAENAPSSKKIERGVSKVKDSTGEDKTIRGRKRALTEIKKKNSSEGAKSENFAKGDPKKGVKNGLTAAKAKTKKVKGSLPVADEEKSNSSLEMDKENRPVHIESPNVKDQKQQTGKSTRPTKIKYQEKKVTKPVEEPAPGIPKVRTDPVWFILSGHSLQRKEFRKVIKHLKGRVCKDSHQWNYQATHFIVPDPLRRTEKFFAAAASGRWILKTDYLTASNEAGELLAEEPYEWHKKGLNEDGAINLEAPRKWRLLKERTGHGAFYGMRIIIYGDCIAPSLETLKRVVKAGDGTILATSPPYNRLLESGGIDFAIVSPGTLQVDIWVQEFLRHQVPCVVADYLVEYVCKPGYSLDKHVQYGTHAWVEKSLRNLENRLEEAANVMVPNDGDDIKCHRCGSGDNGEEMLICGDETGSSGCGIGAHISCCDPPLEEIPEGDWYCEKCSNKDSKNTGKKSSKSSPSGSRSKPK